MPQLAKLLENAVEQSEFHAGSKSRVKAAELRSLYAEGERWRLFSTTKCPDDALNGLVGCLEECLGDVVNHECGFTGYGVDHVAGVFDPQTCGWIWGTRSRFAMGRFPFLGEYFR